MAKGNGAANGILTPSEDQDKIRRANKAKKRSQSSPRTVGLTGALGPEKQSLRPRWQTPLFGAVKDPKVVEAERQRAIEAETARIKHAAKALTSTNITTLADGSIAHKMAVKTLHLFPLVTVDREATGRGRLAEAIEAAKATLEPAERARVKAIDMGAQRARFALNWASNQQH